MYTISIQDKVLLFKNRTLIGNATIEEIEDFCKEHNLSLPDEWDEKDEHSKLLIKEFFGVNN